MVPAPMMPTVWMDKGVMVLMNVFLKGGECGSMLPMQHGIFSQNPGL